MSADHRFQVNLRGIIDLLSKNLYSGPQVYIRELLQNGVDAITARTRLEPDHVGEIKLEIQPGAGDRPPTLLAADNGVGLTEEQVHRFLATIGESSKRDAVSRQDFIGQFGIGLLSGFVVSEEIVVITRSVEAGSKPVEWRGRSDGTYSVRTLDHEFDPGTQVYLRAKAGSAEFFQPKFVRNTARHFGSLLPFPIQVITGVERNVVNEDPPWRLEHSGREQARTAALAYGERVFETEFFDAIPLRSEAGGVEGIAFVLPHAASLAGKRTHRVYLKNMLLSEHADNLLPDWAFFVKCVVNSSDLRPTASRESFYEDERLEAARTSLGECLRRYLVDLARHDRSRLEQLIDVHYLAIKALAVEDDEFYRLFIGWLPFETSAGRMTLDEYGSKDPIRFVRTRDQFRQIAGVASAQGQCIFNAGYTYDEELLAKLPLAFPGRDVEPVDVSQWSQTFAELTLDEREVVFGLMKLADLTLQPFGCEAEVRKFDPAELPALYTVNESAAFLRSVEQTKEISNDLWSGVLENVASPHTGDRPQLCLNFKNPLVRKLAGVKDRPLARRSLEMLYVQALLMGHYPLRAKELAALNQGLLSLIEYGIQRHTGETS